MHELVKAVIEKHREKNKEVEEYLSSQKETQISYSPSHILQLVESGHLPEQLGDWFFKKHEENNIQYKDMQDFIEKNPDIPKEERLKHFFKEGPLSIEETIKQYEDAAFSGELLMHLLKNRHLLVNDFNLPTIPSTQTLFNNVDTSEEFGIANCISNSLYYLEELLSNMELTQLYENLYEAKGCVKNTKGESISLNYSFQSTSKDEANKLLKEYKSIMITKGLKIWFAYWLMANKQGRVEYSCPMIEIMKLVSNEDRESFFSVKEKEEHWALTKMMEMSKLCREKKIKKRGTGADTIEWIEQPLVQVLGGQKEEDKYPTNIAVRVLTPRIDKKGFSPNIYKNATLTLSPSDTFLAYKLQTRAAQMGRGSRNLHVDWDFIFEAGNLQTTAHTKKAAAKALARKKMDRLQQSKIIEKWDEELMGVCVTPKKTKQGKGLVKNSIT